MQHAGSPAQTQHKPLKWGQKAYPHPGTHWKSGNRCGHDPKKPKLTLTGIKHRLLGTQKQALKALEDYYDRPEMLPTLAWQEQRSRNRSEGREAEIRLFAAIIICLDFESMRVGTPLDNGDFKYQTLGELACIAGMVHPDCDPDTNPRPSRRALDAFERLKQAGILEVTQRAEEIKEGHYRAKAAIKTVNYQALVSLGVVSYKGLQRARDYAKSKNDERRARWQKKHGQEKRDAQSARQAMTRRYKHQGRSAGTLKDNNPRKTLKEMSALNKQRNDYFMELWVNEPGRTDRWYADQVNQKYPPKPPPKN